MKSKVVHVVATDRNGLVLFDRQASGKANGAHLFIDAMFHIDDINAKDVVIKKQEVGAKGWASFSYSAGDTAAYRI